MCHPLLLMMPLQLPHFSLVQFLSILVLHPSSFLVVAHALQNAMLEMAFHAYSGSSTLVDTQHVVKTLAMADINVLAPLHGWSPDMHDLMGEGPTLVSPSCFCCHAISELGHTQRASAP